MVELLVSLNINFSFDSEFTVFDLVNEIKNLEIEKVLAGLFIEKYDEMIVTAFCGEKYAHNKEEPYDRAGNGSRTIVTKVGELKLKPSKIKDNVTGEVFKPVLSFLGVEPYKRYSDDVSFTCVDVATKSTYRDAKYILENFFDKVMSPSTINRRVKELGVEIKDFVKNKTKNLGEEYEYLWADGTKSHSQESRSKNDIKVAITTNDKGEKVLLSCNVNKSWSVLNEEIVDLDVLKSDAVLISDAEAGLRKSIVNGEMGFQLDFIHFIRDIGYKLWNDGKLDLDTRKKIKSLVEEIIYKLKNQCIKYGEDTKILREKVNEAVDRLKDFCVLLEELCCFDAARFVKKYSNHVVTFAMLKCEGRDIPWNSNIIERLMGEIQKRCKHKWMRWTTDGQEAMLNLILTRYINPEYYEEFKSNKLKTNKTPKIKAIITT